MVLLLHLLVLLLHAAGSVVAADGSAVTPAGPVVACCLFCFVADGSCSRHSRRGLVQEYKRTVFAYTHGLFIT